MCRACHTCVHLPPGSWLRVAACTGADDDGLACTQGLTPEEVEQLAQALSPATAERLRVRLAAPPEDTPTGVAPAEGAAATEPLPPTVEEVAAQVRPHPPSSGGAAGVWCSGRGCQPVTNAELMNAAFGRYQNLTGGARTLTSLHQPPGHPSRSTTVWSLQDYTSSTPSSIWTEVHVCQSGIAQSHWLQVLGDRLVSLSYWRGPSPTAM